MIVYGHVLDVLLLVGLVLFVVTGGVVIWRLLRCVHAWELVDKTEFPPAIEVFHQYGVLSKISGYLGDRQAERMCRKTLVIVLRCPKCGAAKIWSSNG